MLYSASLTLKVGLQSQGNTTEQQEIQQSKLIKIQYIDIECKQWWKRRSVVETERSRDEL